MAPPELRIAVVYVVPGREDVVEVLMSAGATVADAIERSGVLQRHPQPAGQALDVGVWGHICRPERLLEDGDRVEIYRPLTVDPKEARRVRAAVRRRRAGGG